MNDTASILDRLIAGGARLYSLPTVAVKVLDLTKNPQVDTRALKECIENDPALTGKILGVVNSSLFGLGREVRDLNQALTMLGSKPLKLLVLGFSLPVGLFAGITSEVLGRYWRNTLTKAVAGRELAESLWNISGDDAFLAGLLQDVGILLLIQQLRDPYVKLFDRAHTASEDLAKLEARSMGFDHTELSARLLAHWRLPETLVEAISLSDPIGRSEGRVRPQGTLRQILHLANLLARMLADGRSEVLGELLEVGEQYRALSVESLGTLVANLEEKIDQLADVLSLQLPEGMDYRDVLIEAHSRLADAAGDAASALFRQQQAADLKPEEDALLADLRDVAAAVARVSERQTLPPYEAEDMCFASDSMGPFPEPVEPVVHASDQTAPRPCHAASTATLEASPTLLDRLLVAATASRELRCPLSLLLVALHCRENAAVVPDVDDSGRLWQSLQMFCREIDHPGMSYVAQEDAPFALILPDCERRQAVEYGNRLIELWRNLGTPDGDDGRPAASISVGTATVALPPKNFAVEDLLLAADRCLYGSRVSGGRVVKSIEIY